MLSRLLQNRPERKTPRKTAGFTLIEIGIVLAIVAVLTVASLPFFASQLAERRLREPANILREWVAEARTEAMSTGKATAIRFLDSEFQLELEDQRNSEDAVPADSLLSPYPLQEGMRFEYRLPGEEEWSTPGDYRWVFQPSGVCLPIAVRFSYNNDTLELDFDPLTGMVAEERFYIQ